jgi:hypothetical protein
MERNGEQLPPSLRRMVERRMAQADRRIDQALDSSL